MRELSYSVPRPHFLRLTLEDCALCLKNLTDPMLYSAAVIHSNDLDEEFNELQEAQESIKEMEDSSDEETDITINGANTDTATNWVTTATRSKITTNHTRTDVVLSNMFKYNTTFIEVWLNDFFEEEEGGSVARCEIYKYFLENCQKCGITPCNPANFGKVMRMVFPNIQTRRIGIRGRSKYHYVGIAPRTRDGISTNDESKRFDENACISHRLSSQDTLKFDHHANIKDILSLLSEFPAVNEMDVITDLKNEVSELLRTYKLHAVQIINNILDADFYKVKDHIEEFWRSLPLPLFVVIGSSSIIDIMEMCDRQIYKVVSDILVPHVFKSLPTGLMQALTDFVENFQYWLEEVLSDYPTAFRERKLKVCSQFRTSLQRRVNISHMATTARFILHSHDSMKELLRDWQDIEVKDIVVHCQNLFVNNRDLETKIRSYMVRLQQLMIQNSTLDQYMAWIKAIIYQNMQNIVKVRNSEDMVKEFILNWSYVSGQIIQQLSVNTATSLGPFHLLDLLFKDYALYLMEEWIQY